MHVIFVRYENTLVDQSKCTYHPNMIDCLQVVRVYSFMKEVKLCIRSSQMLAFSSNDILQSNKYQVCPIITPYLMYLSRKRWRQWRWWKVFWKTMLEPSHLCHFSWEDIARFNYLLVSIYLVKIRKIFLLCSLCSMLWCKARWILFEVQLLSLEFISNQSKIVPVS